MVLERGISSRTGLAKVGVSFSPTNLVGIQALTFLIGASTWSVGSSMVAGGLVWYHAMIAIIIGHLIGSLLTVWNGRGGSVYHIGVRDLFSSIRNMWLTSISVPRLD